MKIEIYEPGAVPADATAVQITMRDGAEMAADVYRAGDDAPTPVVLIRLPYDKDGVYCFMPEVARHFVRHGYAVVVQDVRGKFRSGGATQAAINEVDDGYDTIDWVARQPWCNGDVVMFGDSYFGLTQLAAAMSEHPALRAIVPRVTGTQLSSNLRYTDASYLPEPTSRREYFASHYVEQRTYEWSVDWHARPLADQFESFFKEIGRRSEDYDSELTASAAAPRLRLADLVNATPVPTLFTVGWYDNCAPWSWYDVETLIEDPRWGPNVYLHLEAIDHENYRLTDVPISADTDHTRSDDARALLIARATAPALRFFEHHLMVKGDSEFTKVTYEICQGAWATSDAWPPPKASDLILHVNPTGDSRHGLLTDEPTPEGGDILQWTSNGIDLVPSVADDPFGILAEFRDLGPDTHREDVATADGAPVEEALVLAGPVTLSGVIRSDMASTDVFARLLDVASDGVVTLITRGAVRLTDLEGPTRFEVSLLHAAYRLAPGHKIRLHLASTDFPEFMFNTGDGSDAWTAERAPETTTVLQLGGDGGLRLALKVVPASERTGVG